MVIIITSMILMMNVMVMDGLSKVMAMQPQVVDDGKPRPLHGLQLPLGVLNQVGAGVDLWKEVLILLSSLLLLLLLILLLLLLLILISAYNMDLILQPPAMPRLRNELLPHFPLGKVW